MSMNLMDYIMEQSICVLVPALYILGMMLKIQRKLKDWTIPWILLTCGIACCIAIMGFSIQAILQELQLPALQFWKSAGGSKLRRRETECNEQ